MPKKIILSLVASISLFAAPQPAEASAVSNVLISDITIGDGTSVARVWFNGATKSGTTPTCHMSPYTTHYAFDISTHKGKAVLALLQSAFLAGRKVSVNGAGNSCTTVTGTTSSVTGANTGVETLSNLTVFP